MIGMKRDCASTKKSGSPIQSHPFELVPWKFTSGDAEKNVWNRLFASNAFTPDCPPSPKMVTNQGLFTFSELNACVPLSCVPPMMSASGSCELTERLWNWSVPRLLFSVEIVVGTFESQFWQSVRSSPVSPRDEHWLETFENEPLSLQTPPSFAMKTLFGSNGVAAIACWSGCRLTPCVSIVMSVKLTPASSDRWMARPFDRPPSSLYCIELPM